MATNSTINVAIFGSKPKIEEKKTKPIFFIDDKRIFTISGIEYNDEDKKDKKGTINYFDYIVNNLLPNLDTFQKEEDILNRFVESLKIETKDENR